MYDSMAEACLDAGLFVHCDRWTRCYLSFCPLRLIPVMAGFSWDLLKQHCRFIRLDFLHQSLLSF